MKGEGAREGSSKHLYNYMALKKNIDPVVLQEMGGGPGNVKGTGDLSVPKETEVKSQQSAQFPAWLVCEATGQRMGSGQPWSAWETLTGVAQDQPL